MDRRKNAMMERFSIENNGCIEVDESPEECPLIVTIIGPIRVWWNEWESDRHKEYTTWRDEVRIALVKSGCAVYSPHRAIQGRWNIKLQEINDAAIRASDIVIAMTPDGVEANGTAGEILVAEAANVSVLRFPPGSNTEAMIEKVKELQKQKQRK